MDARIKEAIAIESRRRAEILETRRKLQCSECLFWFDRDCAGRTCANFEQRPQEQ